MMSLCSHLTNHKVLCHFSLHCFSHFYFYWQVDLLPSNELDPMGRLIIPRGSESVLLGKRTPVCALWKAKQIKALAEPKLWSPWNPWWFRGFSDRRIPARLNTDWLKSLGFCVRQTEVQSYTSWGVLLARLPYWKYISCSVKWSNNHTSFMGLLWELNEKTRLEYPHWLVRAY